MAKIENREVLKRIEKECFLHPAAEAIPNQLSNAIVPVIVANPEKVVNVIKKGLASGTTYTTPSDKDFYLTGISISSAAANGSATVIDSVTVTPKGQAAIEILACIVSTGAASEDSGYAVREFNPPILLERGTAVTSVKGSDTTRQVITGYTVEKF